MTTLDSNSGRGEGRSLSCRERLLPQHLLFSVSYSKAEPMQTQTRTKTTFSRETNPCASKKMTTTFRRSRSIHPRIREQTLERRKVLVARIGENFQLLLQERHVQALGAR